MNTQQRHRSNHTTTITRKPFMNSTVRLTIAVKCFLSAIFMTSIGFGQGEHQDLTYYLDANGTRHPVTSIETWEHRRAQILAGMQQAMGPLPTGIHQHPLAVRKVKDEEFEGYRRSSITFEAEPGKRVPVDVYIPAHLKPGEKAPGILALHPTGALGKRIVAGEGPRANRQYAIELVQRGYIVVAPDYPSFGDYPYDFDADNYQSGTMKGIVNHIRCVDLLSDGLTNVDAERIGVIGHSLGGHNAMFVAAFDERIDVIVSSCGWTPFHDYYGGKINGWTSPRYMPLLNTKYKLDPNLVPFDFYEVVGALAPRPFFSSSPADDANFDVAGVKKVVPKAKAVYQLYNAADQLSVNYPPCDHDFPTETRMQAYKFIDKALKHTPTKSLNFGAELPRLHPREPDAAMESFSIADGFSLQQIAAEPLVTDPIAVSYDEYGRCYAIEMKGYSEQDNENRGQVRILRDEDGDGIYDQSTVFAKGLSWPTAIQCWNGGVFVGAAPNIYYMKDTNGDFVADEQKVVFTGFGKSNVQGLMNCFRWGLDHRIHGATSSSGGEVVTVGKEDAKPVNLRGRDFSFDPELLDIRPETGGAQHGMSFDAFGRKFVCSNSNHAQYIIYDDHYLTRNRHVKPLPARVMVANDGGQAPVFRTSPVEPWRIVRTRLRVAGSVRGPVEGGGRPAGYFTGATGITIFTGDAYQGAMANTAVIGDVGSNIVHRKKLTPKGVTFSAGRIDQNSELVSSNDIWFRPAQYANGPDGCLHILDMYREVIEHPKSLPPEIKQHLDLTSGRDRGRIYRLIQNGFKPRNLEPLGDLSSKELVPFLAHANSWHRLTASRLLYQRRDETIVPELESLIAKPNPLGSVNALALLNSLDKLKPEHLLTGFGHESTEVRQTAAKLSEGVTKDADIIAGFTTIDTSQDARLAMQVAFSAGEYPADVRTLILPRILSEHADQYIQMAVMTSLTDNGGAVLQSLTSDQKFVDLPHAASTISKLVTMLQKQNSANEVSAIPIALRDLATHPNAGPIIDEVVFELARSRSPLRTQKPIPDLIESMLKRSRRDAFLATAPTSARTTAIARLVVSSDAKEMAALAELLNATEAVAIQNAVVTTLSAAGTKDVPELLLAHWDQVSPSARLSMEQTLLSRSAWASALLDAIEAKRITINTLSLQASNQLQASADAKIAARAKSLIVQSSKSQSELLKQYRPALTMTGDVSRGRALFKKNCATCHRLENTGVELGPNLRAMKARGADAILTNVLDPNREVNPQYVSYNIATIEGRTHSGIILEEGTTSITLVQAENKKTTLLRQDIDEIRSSGKSLMPEGMEKKLTVKEMADVIAYLMFQ